MIQQIEKLGAKLKAGSVRQGKVFEDRKVPVSEVWTEYAVLASIPERAQGGIHESACIEQSAWQASATVGIGYGVRPL